LSGACVRICLLLLFFAVAVEESRADERKTPFIEWHATNIQYLYGFNWNIGKDIVDTVTLEHADAWRYGDNYFFMDVYHIAEQRRRLDFIWYLEYHPRISLSKIFGLHLAFGPIKDVLLAHEFDFADRFFSHSTGIGFSLSVPRFSFANAKFMVRDNVRAHGVTWHMVFDWEVPFTVASVPLVYGGYIDVAGPEGSYVDTIYSDTQLLLDVGKWLGRESHLFVGVEFRYIHNQFYIDGADEYIPQPIVKWVF
jgi:nucleoside-specific outer membrane channel protein Tsx